MYRVVRLLLFYFYVYASFARVEQKYGEGRLLGCPSVWRRRNERQGGQKEKRKKMVGRKWAWEHGRPYFMIQVVCLPRKRVIVIQCVQQRHLVVLGAVED